MHLTNYAINKRNEDFIQNNNSRETDSGTCNDASKRSLSWFWAWLHYQGKDINLLWSKISDLVVKTIISAQPALSHQISECKKIIAEKSPFTCFELLGFDILITDSLEPILLEVNHSPSFRTDSQLDLDVKLNLIKDTLNILNVQSDERSSYFENRTIDAQLRLYGDSFTGMAIEKNLRKRRNNRFSDAMMWTSYLLNERKQLGEYVLLYPTNEYPNQPTRGKQELYDNLIHASATLYWERVSSGGISLTKMLRGVNATASFCPSLARSDTGSFLYRTQNVNVDISWPVPSESSGNNDNGNSNSDDGAVAKTESSFGLLPTQKRSQHASIMVAAGTAVPCVDSCGNTLANDKEIIGGSPTNAISSNSGTTTRPPRFKNRRVVQCDSLEPSDPIATIQDTSVSRRSPSSVVRSTSSPSNGLSLDKLINDDPNVLAALNATVPGHSSSEETAQGRILSRKLAARVVTSPISDIPLPLSSKLFSPSKPLTEKPSRRHSGVA